MPAGPGRGSEAVARHRLRVAIVGDSRSWHVSRLTAALAARGHACTVVGWPELSGEIRVDGPPGALAAHERFAPTAVDAAEAIFVRSMPDGGLERVILRMDLLGRMAANGKVVVNAPRALEIAIDKYLSLARLSAAGLPVPRTIVAQNPEATVAAWQELGGDCVVKPLFGSQGRGLVRVRNIQALEGLFGGASSGEGDRSVAYLQEFVPHLGWDVRILTIGERTFAIRRFAAGDDWRTNLSLGGRAERFTAPPGWSDLAVRAARAVNAEVAGVDLLPARDGRILVLEVNAVPGWRGLESATQVDIGQEVVRHLESMLASGHGGTASAILEQP